MRYKRCIALTIVGACAIFAGGEFHNILTPRPALVKTLKQLGNGNASQRWKADEQLRQECAALASGLAKILHLRGVAATFARTVAAELIAGEKRPVVVQSLVEQVDLLGDADDDDLLARWPCARALTSFGAQAVAEIVRHVNASATADISEVQLQLYAEVLARCFRDITGDAEDWCAFALERIDSEISTSVSDNRNLWRLRAAVEARGGRSVPNKR